ncbi:hypothetical protein GCM10007103_21580 [Salinimicrobium marinum]|uniref:DUF962 domain-containing protein n=1 Tax=Salinimicrobium marinum TaxID=680283 RepID=A0A918SFV5_9FLAO|nr:DUF962 domain-containing protein [Salinimicrobium marinum]GHA39856.1 hypothetical protein GCM10007103_21580 [Salinimicrobium marinum]
MAKRITTYSEFYRFYLTEHQNKTSRILHFTGTFLVFVLLFLAIFNSWGREWIFIPVVGYTFAWIGHAFYEKNRPATLSIPSGVSLSILNYSSNFSSEEKASTPERISE